MSEDARLETVRIIGGVEGKFGMPLGTLIETARVAARSEHVELLAVKAPFGAADGLVLRLVNLSDKPETARLVLASDSQRVFSTLATELGREELPLSGRVCALSFRPFELKTLLLEAKG